MNPRVIATDIDGTLLNSDRQLSERTIRIFRSLPDDVPVILASSRMPSAMTHLQRELDVLSHPLVCYNGGYVIKYNEGSERPVVFSSTTIPVDVCESILSLAQGRGFNVSLYFEDEWIAPQLDHWTEREQRITKVNPILRNPSDTLKMWRQEGHGAHKVMCMGDEEEINRMEKSLNEKHLDDIHVYRSRSTYLELAPKSISKASGIEIVLTREFGLSMNDLVAFGDNYNDIHMLQEAGIGVAVGNAHDEVKAVANFITSKSIEDGVALFLEDKLFKVSER